MGTSPPLNEGECHICIQPIFSKSVFMTLTCSTKASCNQGILFTNTQQTTGQKSPKLVTCSAKRESRWQWRIPVGARTISLRSGGAALTGITSPKLGAHLSPFKQGLEREGKPGWIHPSLHLAEFPTRSCHEIPAWGIWGGLTGTASIPRARCHHGMAR